MDDPATRHCFYGSGDIYATTLTGDNKVANAGSRSVEHKAIVGEEKTNIHCGFFGQVLIGQWEAWGCINPADCLSFLNDLPWIFVISQRNKLRVAQMIRTSPFQET